MCCCCNKIAVSFPAVFFRCPPHSLSFPPKLPHVAHGAEEGLLLLLIPARSLPPAARLLPSAWRRLVSSSFFFAVVRGLIIRREEEGEAEGRTREAFLVLLLARYLRHRHRRGVLLRSWSSSLTGSSGPGVQASPPPFPERPRSKGGGRGR
jgi:hypothetical protein